MKKLENTYLKLLILGNFLLLAVIPISAQDYSLNVSSSEFSMESKSYKGFATDFNIEYQVIKKEWWRYIKKIAVIENHKAFYVITFPTDKNDSSAAVQLISVLEDNENWCTLKTAHYDQQLNEKYISFSKNILIDFKVSLFTKSIQKKIVVSEKEAIKLSRIIDVNTKKIASYEYKKQRGKGNIRELAFNIKQVEVVQDSLKLQLIYVQKEVDDNRMLLKKIK